MHVAGEERPAVTGVRAREREVVAAEPGRLLAARIAERVMYARRARGAPQIDDLGSRDGRGGERRSDERRVPLGARWIEELRERRGEQLVRARDIQRAVAAGHAA
jgi:hypothetical protein